jgi:multidrug transporter EmrE-like cation transporter
MKDVVSLVVGLAAAGIAIWQSVVFLRLPGAQSGGKHAVYAGIAIVVAIICGAIFFAGRVNKEEEIHITQ